MDAAVMSTQKEILSNAVGWDIVNWSKALHFWEQFLPSTLQGKHFLELGCGNNAGLTLWLARAGASGVCSGYNEIPQQVIKTHQHLVPQAEISYNKINALELPYTEQFDIVCFKSMLGGIVRLGELSIAETVIKEIYKSLKPGGILLFAENLSATAMHAFIRKRFGSGKNNWRYFTYKELNSVLSPYFTVTSASFGVTGLFGANETMRSILGEMDTLLFEKIFSDEQKYIYAAYCIKK